MMPIGRFRGAPAAISNVRSKNPDRAVKLWRDLNAYVFVPTWHAHNGWRLAILDLGGHLIRPPSRDGACCVAAFSCYIRVSHAYLHS